MVDMWKQFERNPISHSVAHHLIAIAELLEKAGYARVSDVARMLGITRGSASLTLKTLKQRGLVVEDENRFLRLSPEGDGVANAVRGKKFLLHSLLHNVLGISSQAADEDTCKVEHLVSNETADRLARFLRFILSDDPRAKTFLQAWQRLNEPCDDDPAGNLGCPVCEADPVTPAWLADLAVGQSARIVRVETNGAIRQRLLDMGVTRGAVVKVKRLAPLGDPIQVSVKGYDLAIRRDEARAIRVEPEGG